MEEEIKNNNKDEAKSNSTVFEQFRICPYRYAKKSTPYISSDDNWVSQLITETNFEEPIPFPIRKQLKIFAQKIYKDNAEAYKSVKDKLPSNKADSFYGSLLHHGTTKDKIAAHMLKCMEEPLYSLDELFSLVDLLNVNHQNCNKAIADIANVFQMAFLPNRHVAKEFECHNFMDLAQYLRTNLEIVEKQLMLWYFEDGVRSAYLKFIENIDKLCYDTNAKVKLSGIKGLHITFKNHPMQDSELVLKKLVNKLGDANKMAKGNVLYALTEFQKDNRTIKPILISLVEELLYRPNINSNAQYFGLCLLKDTILSSAEIPLAEKLMKIYFQFFELLSKKGEVDSRFMAALLRGISRAYPYLKNENPEILNKQLETLYKLSHLVSFSVGTQALQLIYQIQSASDDAPSDRLYAVVYNMILSNEFGNSSFKSAFLNLIFKMMVRDHNKHRVCSFVRRLLQISRYLSSEISSGILYLISETIRYNRLLKKDIVSFLRTGFDSKFSIKDIKGEGNEEVYENSKNKNILKSLKNGKVSKKNGDNEWQSKNKNLSLKQEIRTANYDPNIRNPLYSGGDLLPFWELIYFQKHFHPTVSLFASRLLHQIFIQYSGDPLEDLTLTRFLDRFIHRNPKQIKVEKNEVGTIFGNRSKYTPKGSRNINVESDVFKGLKDDDVAPEDMFLHSYFTTYHKPKVEKKRKRDDDEDSIPDEEFDKYLRKLSGFENIDEEFDEDDADLDFASKVDNVREENEDEDDISEGEDDDKDSENEELFSGEDEPEFDLSEDDNNLLSDGDDESDFSESGEMPTKKEKLQKGKKKPESWGNWRDKLVDADEFSRLLEENNDKYVGTSEDTLNKDKSSKKQLHWEKNRGLSGNKRPIKKFKSNKKEKKTFNKKTFKNRKNKKK